MWRLLVSVLLLLPAGEALANKCLPPSLPRERGAADVIFTGRALRATDDGDTVFAVERVYKGEAPAEVVAHFQGNKYARLSPPGRFVVFAILEYPDGQPQLMVRACSGSGPADALSANVAKLGAGHAPGAALASGKRPRRPSRNACMKDCLRRNLARDCADENGGGLAPCPCDCP